MERWGGFMDWFRNRRGSWVALKGRGRAIGRGEAGV